MDYRGTAQAHPALCVDTRYASFLDDALSLSPETGELLVHVVDVVRFALPLLLRATLQCS